MPSAPPTDPEPESLPATPIDPALARAIAAAVAEAGAAGALELCALDASGRGLHSLVGIHGCPALQFLDVSARSANGSHTLLRNTVRSLQPLAGLEQLQHLNLDELPLPNLVGLPGRALRILSLRDCAGLGDIDALSAAAGLERLSLAGCRSLRDLRVLPACERLQILDLSLVSPDELPPFGQLSRLRKLALTAVGLRNLGALVPPTSLEVLDLSGNPLLADSVASPLPPLPTLQAFRASGCGLHRFSLLTAAPALELLALDHNALASIDDLSNYPRLQLLDLSYNPLSSLEPLAEHSTLTQIILDGIPTVDLGPLSSLPALREVVGAPQLATMPGYDSLAQRGIATSWSARA
jgi:Leucine-rich repeat (LRR) protein